MAQNTTPNSAPKFFNRDVVLFKSSLWGGAQGNTLIIDADGNIQAPITTTNLTTTGNTTLGNASTDTLTVPSTSQFNAPLTVGVNDTGYDVNFFGATTGKKMFWDESADTLFVTATLDVDGPVLVGVDDTGYDVTFFGATAGKKFFWDESADTVFLTCTVDVDGTVTVGVDGTGYDVKFFGDTASNSWLWDESADKVVQTFTSASTDGGTSVEPYTITSTMTGIGGVGGRFKSQLTVNAAAGGWTNAIKGEAIYGASGRTDGLGSAVLAEMTLSAGTTSGTYAPLEIELNCGSNAPIGTNTALAYLSVNGTATNFIDSGHVLNLQGLGAAASGKIFQANTALAATHALKILIGSTPYYIMLTDTGA